MKYFVRMKKRIIEFLQREITNTEYIIESNIIGSFVESEIYNDIDIIILFKPMNDLNECLNYIKQLKLRFKITFDKNLHVSAFTSREKVYFNLFKSVNSLIKL